MSATLNALEVALAAIAGTSIAAEPAQPAPTTPVAAAPATPAAFPRVVPDVEKLANDKYGQMVRMGRDLVLKTCQFIDPEVPDLAKRFARATSWLAEPVQTMEDRINGCMEGARCRSTASR